MKINKLVFLATVLLGLSGFSLPFSWIFSHPNPEKVGTSAWLNRQMSIIESQTDNIDPQVLRYSLIAYANAKKQGLDPKQILTVIDYSKPSNEKRLWVFDLKN